MGKWVVLGEPDEVLMSADTPQEILAWLSMHNVTGSLMFRVPLPGEPTELIGPLD